MTKLNKTTVNAAGAIQNWGTLNKKLNKLTFDEVRIAINLEARGRARQTVLARLVARFGKLAAKEAARDVAKIVAGRK